MCGLDWMVCVDVDVKVSVVVMMVERRYGGLLRESSCVFLCVCMCGWIGGGETFINCAIPS